MLSHIVMPAFFKIDNSNLGVITLTVGGKSKDLSDLNPLESKCLDTKLIVCGEKIPFNSSLIGQDGEVKIQIQLLEDELLDSDTLNSLNISEKWADENYLGRTEEQIIEIETALIEAELNGDSGYGLSGNSDELIDEYLLFLDDSFSQPILLDTCWKKIYNLLYKATADHTESANQTKIIYLQVAKYLNELVSK